MIERVQSDIALQKRLFIGLAATRTDMVDDNHQHIDSKPRVKDVIDGKVMMGKYGPELVVKRDLFGNIIPETETSHYQLTTRKSLS